MGGGGGGGGGEGLRNLFVWPYETSIVPFVPFGQPMFPAQDNTANKGYKGQIARS